MNNLWVFQILMMLGMAAVLFVGGLAFMYMKSPNNILVVIPTTAVCAGIVFLYLRKEKAVRFNVFYSTVSEIGSPIYFGNWTAAFERDGTRFDARFPKNKYKPAFKISFYIPNCREKFCIQKRILIMTFYPDCQIVEAPNLPPDYHLQSRNPAFLKSLLNKRRIRDEVLNYGTSFVEGVSISFDDGAFEMIWTPPRADQIDGFYTICHTAVVFHDELRKISGR